LIGTNGKSTLMKAIGGFVPSVGRIEVLEGDVSSMPAYRRHRVGLVAGSSRLGCIPR
jgi:ABC-type branched-subunit amino acid transport system ATPase component